MPKIRARPLNLYVTSTYPARMETSSVSSVEERATTVELKKVRSRPVSTSVP